ncbi:MAG: glycosyltransferase family 4 protein [Terriglobia bacterium]|jgi:glycosyltransferase involved in cell wall biosynthesis
MKKRVAILVGVPTPYREPLFERLARSADYDIQVLYCRDHQPGQQWRLGAPHYPARYLKNFAPERWHGRLLVGAINPGVWRELRAFRPDAVVIYGYNTATSLLAILWVIRHRIPMLMRTDSNVLAEPGKPQLRRSLKRLLLRWLARRVSAFLSVGTMNSQYWQFYGAAPEKIFLARYAVDNEFFQTQAASYRGARQRTRDENGWKQRYLLLYVGRLVPFKRVDLVIEAMRRLSTKRSDIGLVIVGDGPERERLEGLAQGMPYVYFAGFQQQSDLPKYYGVADIFVLPSEWEPWGLVVNEAMASGLPVIATRKVGAARDLIVEGENGYLVPENDVEAMASAVDRACESEQHLLLLGEKARGTVQSWNYDSTLAGFHDALSRCFEAKNSPGDDAFYESR